MASCSLDVVLGGYTFGAGIFGPALHTLLVKQGTKMAEFIVEVEQPLNAGDAFTLGETLETAVIEVVTGLTSA